MPKKTHERIHHTHNNLQEGFISGNSKRLMNKNERVIMIILVGGIVLFLLLSIFVLFGKGKLGFIGNNEPKMSPSGGVLKYTPYPTIPPVVNMTIILNERRFNPSTATISLGGYVDFLNLGATAVTIEANDQNSSALNIGSIEPTEDKQVVFNNRGTYTFRSKEKPTMTGIIIVK